ncbi:hypothetical protein BU16DRAFT_205626 [Lophium mytilinum]|uniref:Uncharacterized protein n=1 Tax=Lophium mytilinum TaxID=390894 RepID=A0A6A6RAI2_9PEZI|nr:hypothetical protein BU16DRAFT_205626 [Lophium mytilinum]
MVQPPQLPHRRRGPHVPIPQHTFQLHLITSMGPGTDPRTYARISKPVLALSTPHVNLSTLRYIWTTDLNLLATGEQANWQYLLDTPTQDSGRQVIVIKINNFTSDGRSLLTFLWHRKSNHRTGIPYVLAPHPETQVSWDSVVILGPFPAVLESWLSENVAESVVGENWYDKMVNGYKVYLMLGRVMMIQPEPLITEWTFPSDYERLLRPEDVRTLGCVTDDKKARYEKAVAGLWKAMQENPSDSPAYVKAHKRLGEWSWKLMEVERLQGLKRAAAEAEALGE